MTRNRGKRSTCLVGVVAVLVALTSSIALAGLLRDGWHIWKLEHGDIADRRYSARELGRRGNASTAPFLLKAVSTDCDKTVRRCALVSLIELEMRRSPTK